MTHPTSRPQGGRGLLLCLLGAGLLGSGTALADPMPRYGWLEAQRSWAEQSYRQTQRRLDQLERCLERAHRPWAQERCLRLDEQAREWQWQRDRQEWQSLQRQRGGSLQLTWRP